MEHTKHDISIIVNGYKHNRIVESRKTLLEFLRDDLNLTGTKKGCDMGDCGACTVLMDGKAVYSCLVLTVEANNKEVITIEGLAQDSKLDVIQKAFIKHGALQCGYCTPGMLISIKALLNENPFPDDYEIKRAIAGNLCRCTGYIKIIEAIREATKQERNEKNRK